MKKYACVILISLFSLSGGARGDILEMIVPVLAAVAGGSSPPPSNPSWGAHRLSNSQRPARAWLNQFNGIAAINVPGAQATIESALDACASEYCVISIDQLQLNGTVYLDRPKTKLLGVAGNKITYNGGSGAFIEIENGAQQIVIERLNLDGESLAYGSNDVFGVVINGQNIQNIAIQDNQIHGLNSDTDAHGIAVYGTGNSESNAIENIIISGNNVHHMRTGSSESIVVNGNVKHWEIIDNTVHQVNNIAIDAIGGEGTSPVRVLGGRTLPGVVDAARFGFIERNTVTDMTTLDNPAYDSEHSWAGAIYVDGARDLLIANNSVSNAEWAYDIGAENCVTPNNIVLENNIAAGSYYGDFLLGGYASGGFRENRNIECNPLISMDDNEGHGYVENVTVKGNQFTTTEPVDDQGIINLQYRIRQSIIIQAGVSAEHPNGVVSGDQNSIRIVE